MFLDFSELWDKYESKMDKSQNEYLIEDGLDVEKAGQYFSQKIKVLFVLKESNESDVPQEERKEKSIYKENGWFTNFGSDRGMITKMIKMCSFIQNYSPESNISVREQEVKPEIRYSFAFINLNKHGNGKKISDTDLKTCIENDADLLIKQIKLLAPDVIVFGVKNFFCDFVENILKPLNFNASKVICTGHFSRMSYKDFESKAIRALTSP